MERDQASKFINDLLRLMVSRNGSDLFLTADFPPAIKVDGKVIHQVGLPWHWGHGGPAKGDAANDLVTLSGDPNTSIQESKAFVCNVRAGRKTVGTGILAGVHDPPEDVAVNREHPAENRPERSGN